MSRPRRYAWRCPYCGDGGVCPSPAEARDAGFEHWETWHARSLDPRLDT